MEWERLNKHAVELAAKKIKERLEVYHEKGEEAEWPDYDSEEGEKDGRYQGYLEALEDILKIEEGTAELSILEDIVGDIDEGIANWEEYIEEE